VSAAALVLAQNDLGRTTYDYAVIRQREHLNTGAHGPLYPVGRCSGYSRRNSPHGGPGPVPKCALLPRVTRADPYGPGYPFLVPAYGRPLPDMGGEPEPDHPITPARERSR